MRYGQSVISAHSRLTWCKRGVSLPGSIAMNDSAKVCAVLALLAAVAFAGDDRLIVSVKADNDVAITTNPDSSFWRSGPAVYAQRDTYGKPLLRFRTQIRSRWTRDNLYFLFVCPYDELYLKPNPDTSTETFKL